MPKQIKIEEDGRIYNFSWMDVFKMLFVVLIVSPFVVILLFYTKITDYLYEKKKDK